MEENDWWNSLYGTDTPNDEPGAHTDARPREKKRDLSDDESDRALASVSPATATPHTRRGTGSPVPPSNWGSGRTTDPFLTGNQAIPPKPTQPPASVTKDDDEPASLKDRIRSLRTKATNAKQKTTKAASAVKEKTTQAAGAAATKTEPARKSVGDTIASAAQHASAKDSKFWGFVWAVATAWVVSPQTIVALAQRILAIFGVDTGDRIAWNLMSGPGEWFKQVWKNTWETGQQERLIALALVGILPVMVAQFAEKIESVRLRKALMWIGYGAPVFWICSSYYIHSFGYHNWNEIYTSALFSAAWWCITAVWKQEPGFVYFLMWIPPASIVCGIVTYAPGAAF